LCFVCPQITRMVSDVIWAVGFRKLCFVVWEKGRDVEDFEGRVKVLFWRLGDGLWVLGSGIGDFLDGRIS